MLPFANHSGEPALAWLGEGFAISLEEHLRGAGQITIPYADARAILDRWNIPKGGTITLASALKAAERGAAQRVVVGLFRLHQGEVRVQAQVLDAEDPSQRGKVEEKARLGDLLDLHRRLARALVRSGQQGLPSLQAVRDSSEPPPLAAYEQYVRALLDAQAPQRLESLRRASRAFPNYALLQYRLADLLHDSGRDDEALAALERVREVRFVLSPEAHLLRAEILLERGDAEGAALAAADSLALRDSPRARLLRAEASLERGQVVEAREDLERARRLGAPDEELEALIRRLDALAPAVAR